MPTRIYGDLNSGNCQKVRLTADYLDFAYDWTDVDIMEAQSRTPEFLSANPRPKSSRASWSAATRRSTDSSSG
jgi:glutathione S-transferase